MIFKNANAVHVAGDTDVVVNKSDLYTNVKKIRLYPINKTSSNPSILLHKKTMTFLLSYYHSRYDFRLHKAQLPFTIFCHQYHPV